MYLSNQFSVLSDCYIFKNRLLEYTQRKCILPPVYDTIKEGPSHEFSFMSVVTVADIRYNSLPGFSNHKTAEQSAAEIALTELAKSGLINESVTSPPPNESGLWKHLLQQYTRKMKYALPSYVCVQDNTPGKLPFTCTVQIGSNWYTGAAARSKKAAQINAARVGLIAIQSNEEALIAKTSDSYQYTVIPCKKRTAADSTNDKIPKPKKACTKRKSENKCPVDTLAGEQVAGNTKTAASCQGKEAGLQVRCKDFLGEQNTTLADDSVELTEEVKHREANVKCDKKMIHPSNMPPDKKVDLGIIDQSSGETPTLRIVSEFQIKDLLALAAEIQKVCGAEPVVSLTPSASSSGITTQVHM
ncbi:hypothetical protein ACHQM5_023670 [Ranunculus cassubicifolius]